MAVLRTPFRLKLAIGALFLTVPLAAAETLIATRNPWWQLRYSGPMGWSAAAAAGALVVAGFTARANPVGVSILRAIAWVWIAAAGWYALRSRNTSLGFVLAFSLVYFAVMQAWLRRELSRSFIDPGLAWFQRLPSAIGSLRCHWAAAGAGSEVPAQSFRVSRLDREGVFFFREQEARDPVVPRFGRGRGRGRVDFALEFKDRRIQCRGAIRRSLKRGFGLGVQFDGMSPDQRKELYDFIEILKGEGYVQ